MKSQNAIPLLFLLLAVSGTVKAQQPVEFAPVGAEWYYERFYREGWNFTGITYDRFRSLEKVEINGWECKEIELYQHLDCEGVPNDHYEYRYITQEGEQVFEVENGERLLLYDFNKEPGESWYAPKYQTMVTVHNVSYVTLNDGSIRKVLETQCSYDGHEWYFYYIMEGIGMEYSLFPFNQSIVGRPCSPGPIRCYSENGVPLIVSEEDCDFEVLSIDEQDLTPPVTMNTIVEDLLQIDFSETLTGTKEIVIVDMAGRILHTDNTTDHSISIQLAEIPSGLYVARVQTADRMIHAKFIKQ